MSDKAKTKVIIGVSFLLILAQALLFTLIAENKTQEYILMVIGLILLSETRQYIQKLALIREEELIEQKKLESESKETGKKK